MLMKRPKTELKHLGGALNAQYPPTHPRPALNPILSLSSTPVPNPILSLTPTPAALGLSSFLLLSPSLPSRVHLTATQIQIFLLAARSTDLHGTDGRLQRRRHQGFLLLAGSVLSWRQLRHVLRRGGPLSGLERRPCSPDGH